VSLTISQRKTSVLPVDSAQVVEYGRCFPEDAHLIVDNIDWRINRSAIYKNGVMLLDLLAHNNWERPVYFALPPEMTLISVFRNISSLKGLPTDLCQSEHQADKVIQDRLHTEKMYQNMVHKFGWGNMEKPGIYLDETNRRMSMNFRNNFSRLANQFIIEGDTARAIKSLDRAMELMPDSKVPYNFFVILIAEAYYRAEQLEKGDAILERYLDILDENLRFFFAFKGKKARLISEDREQALVYTNRINQIAEQYQRTEINERGKALFQEYYDTWLNTRQ
jgi:tetratricopeptide (TPR) repeat protein